MPTKKAIVALKRGKFYVGLWILVRLQHIMRILSALSFTP